MKLRSWLDQATNSLQTAAISSERLDAELLLSFILGKSRTWIHAHPEYEMSPSDQKNLDVLVERRCNQEPLAYIFGIKEFYGRDFAVTNAVLVPRPESEDFIELIKKLPKTELSFIDIGTGS